MAKTKRRVVSFGQKIQPSMIYCATKFDGTGLAIQNVDARHVIYLLIRMFQRMGKWKPFTLADLPRAFLKQKDCHHQFNTLVEGGWIIHRTDGRYDISSNLIEECYLASTETPEIATPKELKVTIPIPAHLSAA